MSVDITTTKIEEEDFYASLIKTIDAGDHDRAVKMVIEIGDKEQQVEILGNLARDLARELVGNSSSSPDLALDLALAIALGLARDLDRDRARDLDLALGIARAHARDRDLVCALDVAFKRNRMIVDVLSEMLTKDVEIVPYPGTRLTGIEVLTPGALTNQIAPYLQALSEVQQIISQLKGEPFAEPHLVSISQHSPVSFDLKGVADAINVVRDNVVSWRIEHAKQLAKFEIQQKRAEIAKQEAEILDIKARAAQIQAEVKTKEEQRALEIERGRLENEKMRLEVHQAKIELAAQIIATFAPKLSETERVTYITQFLRPLTILTESPLAIEAETG